MPVPVQKRDLFISPLPGSVLEIHHLIAQRDDSLDVTSSAESLLCFTYHGGMGKPRKSHLEILLTKQAFSAFVLYLDQH